MLKEVNDLKLYISRESWNPHTGPACSRICAVSHCPPLSDAQILLRTAKKQYLSFGFTCSSGYLSLNLCQWEPAWWLWDKSIPQSITQLHWVYTALSPQGLSSRTTGSRNSQEPRKTGALFLSKCCQIKYICLVGFTSWVNNTFLQ